MFVEGEAQWFDELIDEHECGAAEEEVGRVENVLSGGSK